MIYIICAYINQAQAGSIQLKRRDFATDFKFVIGILRLQTRNRLVLEIYNACLSLENDVSPLCNRSEDHNDKIVVPCGC